METINEIEAEQFINSALSFISEQAEQFHTTEQFIEDCLIELIYYIKRKRVWEEGKEWAQIEKE